MDPKTEELSAIVQEIRDRVRARHPGGAALGDIPLPDLMPLVYARDSAEGKVASIGTVNPRAPGLANSILQSVKRMVSRGLNWHVREQVEFNRAMTNCVQATLEALTETNRALSMLAGRVNESVDDARELKDIRVHWVQWREEWERNLSKMQIQLLRSLSDLQGAWQHRVTLLDENHREHMRALHGEYENSLAQAGVEIQKKLWADLDVIRGDYERLIHSELHLLRQRTSLLRAGADVVARSEQAPQALSQVDWLKFGERFRGSTEYVKRHLSIYAERFAGASAVLDIGCGRGEMLEVFREAGIPAFGIDLNEDCVTLCQNQGLAAEKADLFAYLRGLSDGALGGVVCLQVVEHLPPERLPEFVALVHAKLRAGGVFAIETPNPECLAIFATHFYLDPTHTKPVPAPLMTFYMEEAGFGRFETLRLEPAMESMPSLAGLPEEFREKFFGALDYALFGRKLG